MPIAFWEELYSTEMSARVFNPQIMSEMRRILRGSSPGAERERARRNLFGVGPGDHEENRRFLKETLAEQAERSSQEWEFDFLSEQPLNKPGGRFVYEKVSTDRRTYDLRGTTSSTSTSSEEASVSGEQETSRSQKEDPKKPQHEVRSGSTSSSGDEPLDGPAKAQEEGGGGSGSARQTRMTGESCVYYCYYLTVVTWL